jgi:hypothetical protein
MELGKYSIGIGDRFGRQGQAQLRALLAAREAGIEATPVWNKSAREHAIIGSKPADTRAAAEAAVAAAGWDRPYFVDADHVDLSSVAEFIDACDFFTIDVAEFIGRPASAESLVGYIPAALQDALRGRSKLPGAPALDKEFVVKFAGNYLLAVREAGRVYRRIAERKGEGTFVCEVSMDEARSPQSPAELFLILGAAAREKIPLRTLAPKWTGRFNKGVDYEGDADRFEYELSAALAVVDLAVREFGLPGDLKLSIHSGSDKFSLYPRIRRVLKRTGAGLHLKTAGTTWLEEVIGLASSGGDGWEFVKALYGQALVRYDELCGPYLPVLDIDRAKLPAPGEIESWSGADFAGALRHVEGAPGYNPHLRQFLHVSYKLSAEAGKVFLDLLGRYGGVIGRNVTENLLERHIRPLFPAAEAGGRVLPELMTGPSLGVRTAGPPDA